MCLFDVASLLKVRSHSLLQCLLTQLCCLQVQLAHLALKELARVHAFAAHIRFCAAKMNLGVNFMHNTPNLDRVVEMSALTDALHAAFPDIEAPKDYPWPCQESVLQSGENGTSNVDVSNLQQESIISVSAGKVKGIDLADAALEHQGHIASDAVSMLQQWPLSARQRPVSAGVSQQSTTCHDSSVFSSMTICQAGLIQTSGDTAIRLRGWRATSPPCASLTLEDPALTIRRLVARNRQRPTSSPAISNTRSTRVGQLQCTSQQPYSAGGSRGETTQQKLPVGGLQAKQPSTAGPRVHGSRSTQQSKQSKQSDQTKLAGITRLA